MLQYYRGLNLGRLVSLLTCLLICFTTTGRCNFRKNTLKMQLIFTSNYRTELIVGASSPGNTRHGMAKERTAQPCQYVATGNEQSNRSKLPKLCVTECMKAMHTCGDAHYTDAFVDALSESQQPPRS